MVAARTLGVHAVGGFGPNRKIETEEADGSSSGQIEHNLSVLVHGSMWPRSRERTFHLGHSVLD